MLKITVVNEEGTTRMKLEGKLAHEWVREAETAWTALLAMTQNAEVVVDLLGVSFVDDEGNKLLAAMRHAGAELMGGGPFMSALIDEIEDAEIAASEDMEREQPELAPDAAGKAAGSPRN